MKKRYIMFVILVILSNLLGCSQTVSPTITPTVSEPDYSETEGPVEAEECAVPIEFETEEDFVAAVKAPGNSLFDIDKIKYYNRPKTLPQGAILRSVQVMDSYVMSMYTLDTEKQSNDYKKMLNYMWYRNSDWFTGGFTEGWGDECYQSEGPKGAAYNIDSYETSAQAPTDENSEMKKFGLYYMYKMGNAFRIMSRP